MVLINPTRRNFDKLCIGMHFRWLLFGALAYRAGFA